MIRLAALVLGCVQIAAAAPVIRAIVASARPIIVGQAVRVHVTILVPNYFTGQPNFPQFNLEDAIVVLPEETPQNSSERIGGESYAGISVTYFIYPQRPGTFQLPAVEIAVRYAAEPPGSSETTLQLPRLTFAATIPPQAAGLDYFLPTNALTIKQKFDKSLQHLRVGDTFYRSVTVTASRLRAMLIPPTRFEAPNGIAVYPKQAAVDDIKTDRSEFVEGRRIDSATYVLRKEGTYTLPEIRIDWWDLAAHKVRQASLPAIRVEALPNPSYQPEIPPEPDPKVLPAAAAQHRSKRYLRLAVLASTLLLLVTAMIFGWRRMAPILKTRQNEFVRRYRDSERAHFLRLRRACRKGSGWEAYILLLSWLRRFQPGTSLARFLVDADEPELTSEINALTSSLFRDSAVGTWSGQRLLLLLGRIRLRWETGRTDHPVLPPLNPGTN